MANAEFGTGKTVLILTIVAACFAVLWPKIFYPMLMSSTTRKFESDNPNGCCDVIFEPDVNAIKILSEMCGGIFKRRQDLDPMIARALNEGKFSKEMVTICRSEVMNVCGIDIAEFLNEKVRIGQTYRQNLDEIRSFNISVCLRQNFGISPGSLGTPRRMRTWGPLSSRHFRQERPLHLRPEMLHPALRERGRAIPQGPLQRRSSPAIEKNERARQAGMRPPMGGAGHVVPPPKVGPTMSIVMPLYTIGIVVFSMYTIMKIFIKKTGGRDHYKDLSSDPEFKRVVFDDEYSNGSAGSLREEGFQARSKSDKASAAWKSTGDETAKLDWRERDAIMTAITGLLAEVDQHLKREGDTQTQYSTDLKEEKIPEETCTEEKPTSRKDVNQLEQVDRLERDPRWYQNDGKGDIVHEPVGGDYEGDDSKPKVKVMGVETVAECEGGQRWSRPASPNLGVGGHSRGAASTALADEEPQNIFLEGSLPVQSQLIVTDSETQRLTLLEAAGDDDGPEQPVILSGKMTLSLISLDAKLPENGTQHAQPVPLTRNQCGFGSDLESDNEVFRDADSTLFDVDSAVIDEAGSFPRDPAEAAEIAAEGNGGENERVNEKDADEEPTNYATATRSEDAEAEDTGADFSNVEDQEDLQDDDHVWNGGEGAGIKKTD